MKDEGHLRQKQVRVYLDADTTARLSEMGVAANQTEPWCATLVLREGLKALAATGYKFPFPLELEVKQAQVPKIETPRPKRTAA